MSLKYTCNICNIKFHSREELDSHKLDVHSLVYLPFTKEEVQKLYQFLYTRDLNLLTKNMIETISKYNRAVLAKKFQIQSE